ncbi:BACON domain-containing protein [uncultured Muribaculum sp.]|uniref:BACON domain-containing protein n=1 Tax=uncultured Muribaculum sp. TaxID=1918613 RepID=UPI0025FFE0DA|nr:BACON domain-containing protein [uncultured Muribaculum sp.]
MNRSILSTLATILWASAIGCSSTDSPQPNPMKEITADVASLSVPAEGGTYVINVGVTGQGNEWNSIVPSEPWLTMSPRGGCDKSGHYRLTVSATPNNGKENRTGEICIYTAHDNLKIPVTQTSYVPEGSCSMSESDIVFTGTGCAYRDIRVTTYEDVDIATEGNKWLQIAGMPQGTVKSGTEFILSLAPDGPYTAERSATIKFNGNESGKTSTLIIKHQAVARADAFPSRWYYTNDEAEACGWLTSATAEANHDTGARHSFVTAVGVNNRKLSRSIATAYKRSIAASGLYTGDYLLFSVPSERLDAGTSVDFMLTISSADNSAPKYWICEIYDGNGWRMPADRDLHTTPDGEKYSFYTKHFSSYQHASFTQSFILANSADDGMIRVRCRVVGNRNGGDGILTPDNAGEIYLPSHEFHFCTMAAYPAIERKDVKKVGILGNSFTHYFASAFLLKELARSQGHQLDIRVFAKGSQYLSNHLDLERSRFVTSETGYDFVIMQEQSERYAKYAQSPQEAVVDDCRALGARFREGSPAAKIILENTWAFPKSNWNGYGSSVAFEQQLLEGTMAVARAAGNIDLVSPIGVAFDKAVAAGLSDLFYTDSKHPNRNGAYLKSCVNYLMMFGERFDAKASDGGCDPATASRLRSIAEETVIGHESEYRISQ